MSDSGVQPESPPGAARGLALAQTPQEGEPDVQDSARSKIEPPPVTKGLAEIHEMLRDHDFIEARSQPEGVDAAKLRALIKQGREAIEFFLTEEAQARVEAGLFVRFDGYIPGAKFRVPVANRLIYNSYMQTPTGDFVHIEFLRPEYPDLYELSDQLNAWEALLGDEVSSK